MPHELQWIFRLSFSRHFGVGIEHVRKVWLWRNAQQQSSERAGPRFLQRQGRELIVDIAVKDHDTAIAFPGLAHYTAQVNHVEEVENRSPKKQGSILRILVTAIRGFFRRANVPIALQYPAAEPCSHAREHHNVIPKRQFFDFYAVGAEILAQLLNLRALACAVDAR